MPLALPPRLLPVDFRQRFKKSGLRMGTKDWKDYERGKTILWDMNLSGDEYELGIGELLRWLKL